LVILLFLDEIVVEIIVSLSWFISFTAVLRTNAQNLSRNGAFRGLKIILIVLSDVGKRGHHQTGGWILYFVVL
jgi:hypothetical protein